MKRLIYAAPVMLLLGVLTVSCEKENPEKFLGNKMFGTDVSETPGLRAGARIYNETRAFFWDEEKGLLDCSQDGSGCEVKTVAVQLDGTEKDLTNSQAVLLIKLGVKNPTEYFVKNNYRDIFPQFYEVEFLTKMVAGELSLNFEFPYLQINNSNGEQVVVYNFESTIENEDVKAGIIAGGGYSKKVQLNTDTSKPVVWKCLEDGSNCKTSRVSISAAWLAKNPAFAILPTNENVASAEVNNDGRNSKVLFKTNSGANFGVEF